jgi:hypothetical protein
MRGIVYRMSRDFLKTGNDLCEVQMEIVVFLQGKNNYYVVFRLFRNLSPQQNDV